MDNLPLHITGLGLEIPPRRTVTSLIEAVGGDSSLHQGWKHVCVATDEHPSDLATRALTAALAEAQVEASALDLVLAVGVTRDYPASWSVAAEVMRRCGVSGSALGFDLTIGCLGMLVGLQTAQAWLAVRGGGTAAIVSGERWCMSVDRSLPASRALWGHSDGGAAMVVSSGPKVERAFATFHGAEFVSHADYNGLILVKYGGTRFPNAPADEGEQRVLAPVPASEIWATYEHAYARAITALHAKTLRDPSRVVCNQVSPNIVAMIGRVAGVSPDRTCETGNDYGHIGAGDIVVGLRRLADADLLDGPILVASSVPFAFGAGLLTPGPRTVTTR